MIERQLTHKQSTYLYLMTDIRARKIAVLIRFARLQYTMEEVNDAETKPHIIRTPWGELTEEYEIINYVINDSLVQYWPRKMSDRSSEDAEESMGSLLEENEVKSVAPNDHFILARMHEQLFNLRTGLFSLLEQYYRYLAGHSKIKKAKYDSLNAKIKKEIGRLDMNMREHS